eukprot:jgi/Ulvmu1/1055/UM105_0013.1
MVHSQSSGKQSRCPTGPNIAVRGCTPLSRAGSNGGIRSTPSKTASQLSPMDALAATLIIKMRERFGEAAKDVIAQEAIADEVKKFMVKSGSMQEQDLLQLEETIRLRLSGRTPPRNTMVLERKARLKGDEWARVWTYEAARVGREVARDRDIDVEKKERQRKILDEQVQEKKRIEEEEKQDNIKAGVEIMNDIKEWEKEEAERRAKQLEQVLHFKDMRESQVRDKAARLQRARNEVARDEAETAARIAYEVKAEFEREAAERASAKQALVTYLAGNEENKKLRAAAAEQQRLEDLEYMRQYEEILDKQQKERLARLEKLQEWQDKNESKAASMPESKRWIDPAIIQKNWEERERARSAEERRRRDAVADRNASMVAVLNEQVAARRAAGAAAKDERDAYSKRYLATAEAERVRDLEERRQRVQLKLQAKLDLEAQMRENARRRTEAPMSDIERMVNAPLLRAVDTFENTEVLPLKPYPAEFLPRDLKEVQAKLSEAHARGKLKSARGLVQGGERN